MKIKTQFISSMVIFGVMLLIIAASVIATNQQVELLNRQEEIAKKIEREASELGYLSNDYLLYHESQQRTRWESKFSQLSDDVSNLNPESPEQQTLVNNIRANQQRLKAVFNDIASTLEGTSQGTDQAFQTSWSRMAIQNQGMAFDAERLAQTLRDQAHQLEQTNMTLIFALLGIFGAYFLTNYLIVYRRALRSISDLQDGTRIIGSGNLDYFIKTSRQDEIGELSRAFNQMTASLKGVTASKTDLEREIAGRKKMENALRESEQRWATTLSSIGDAVISTDVEGRITFMNAVAEALTGWTLAEASAKQVTEVFNIINEYTRLDADNPVSRVLREGMIVGLANHTVLVRKDGTEVPIDDSGAPIRDRDGKTMGVVLVFRDITERKRAEQERETAIEFLHLVNESREMRDLVSAAATFFQQRSGCQATGVRLKDGDDYPYFEARGFPEDFVLAENSLCARDGAVFRDSAGYPIADCMCGNVICGRFDTSRPFFTNRGSFWTNCTTELLATEVDRQAFTRNRCNREGYESVALIALQAGKERLGLLQLNDRRKGFFSPEAIGLWERLADYLAIAMAKFRTEEELRKAHDELEARVQERTAELGEANKTLLAEITERKQAEEKIREQATLLDNAQEAIGVRSLEHNLIYWNKGAQRLYGWTAEEAIGKNPFEFLFKDKGEPPQLIEAKRIVLEKGEWTGELHQVTKDSREIIVESRWTLIHDSENKPKSILVINSDITEKKMLEAHLLRAQRMESIGTLAGGMAHDLNNMLTPIMLSLEMLKGKLKDEQSQKLFTILEKNSKRSADLIKQVLSFARGVEGKCNPLQVKHIITEIEKVAKETFPRNIEIRTDIQNDLFTISGDVTQLHQVIMNLCVNSRDAMPDGGILSITASNFFIDENYARMHPEAKVGSYVVIAVSDTGIGIPPEIMDRIFEPFFTTKEFGKGTGLGLSTALAIVKSHRGFINVYSEVGKGTTFRLYLPSIKTEMQNMKEEQLELLTGQGELVLVAEDEDSIRGVTVSTLEEYGYHALAADDGVDAVALYAQNKDKIKIVLMDMMMPIMDGYASIVAIRKINPGVKIIAVSGLAEKDKLEKIADTGVHAFLQKPYTTGRLLKTIHEILDGK